MRREQFSTGVAKLTEALYELAVGREADDAGVGTTAAPMAVRDEDIAVLSRYYGGGRSKVRVVIARHAGGTETEQYVAIRTEFEDLEALGVLGVRYAVRNPN